MRVRRTSFTIVLTLLVAIATSGVTLADPPGSQFLPTWERTDALVASGQVARTWMWGPQAFTSVLVEDYAEGPAGKREVQYFEKSRMEITNPAADPDSIWYVTNGLLATELITGNLQLGDNLFEQRSPASLNVAGDGDDPDGPTYATFSALLSAPPAEHGQTITQRLDRSGTVSQDGSLANHGVTVAFIDDVTNHAIAGPFWEFMNSHGPVQQAGQIIQAPLFENPFFATGRPISEPYWAAVRVAGTTRDVLMQCFERRCLTYTPDNPDGWQVEAGNIGLHYHAWRYETGGPGLPVMLLVIEIVGIETSSGTVQDGVRYGATFNGTATGDVEGIFNASINYSPPNPGPDVTNTIVGGTWSIVSDEGSISGSFVGGTAVWDSKEELASISANMKVQGISGIHVGVPREARFEGQLDHRGWPPIPPRISGTLVLFR